VRRITKAALGGIAGCALVMGGAGVASGALSSILKIQGFAVDLTPPAPTEQPNVDKIFDSARAKITINKETDSLTTFTIRVTGIDVTGLDRGQTFGSHLHTGPCMEGNGPTAGPHYNHDAASSASSPRIGRETEVWFDLVPDEDGMAYAETTVPFVPVDNGEMSIVVHQSPTNPTTGTAGARQACFPVIVSSELFPTAFPSPTPTE